MDANTCGCTLIFIGDCNLERTEDCIRWCNLERISVSPNPKLQIFNSKMATKRKRNVLTLQLKLELLDKMERGVSRTKLMEEYKVGSSTLYDIKKQSGQLRKFLMETESKKVAETRKTLHQSRSEELDRVLYEWFALKRSEGACISGPMLQEKAKELQARLNVDAECKFSVGWLNRFRERHGIRKLDVSGEQKSADTESADEFVDKFQKFVEENQISPECIYNADETGLLWRCLPTSTLVCSDETSPKGFKKNKDRATVMVCANAAGTHKVKLCIVGKFRNPRCFKNIKNLPVRYQSQKSAWMTCDIFKDWFHNLFVPRVKDHLEQKKMPNDSKIILLLDNCRSPPPTPTPLDDLKAENISVMFLPPNVTSLIQPMDQGVMQNIKTNYRSIFMRRCVNFDGTVDEFQKQFTLKDATFVLSLAWSDVKKKCLRGCWSKLWPLIIFQDGESSDEDFFGFTKGGRSTRPKRLRQDRKPVSDILDIITSSEKIKLDEEQVQDWVDIDSSVPVALSLDDDEIIEQVLGKGQDEQERERDEDDDEDDIDTKKVTWKEADEGLSTFIKFAEQCSSFSAHDLMKLHCMHSEFLNLRKQSCKQSDIRSFMSCDK